MATRTSRSTFSDHPSTADVVQAATDAMDADGMEPDPEGPGAWMEDVDIGVDVLRQRLERHDWVRAQRALAALQIVLNGLALDLRDSLANIN